MSAALDQTEADLLLAERPEPGILRLTLNRPKAYNALSMALMAALQAALDDARNDPAVKAVIIQAAGKGFCAGHDLREVRSLNGYAALERLFKQCSRLMQSIVALPKPVIAQVHGMASAAGCQLVASCDLAIAADTTRFATPGVNIGLFCSTPAVALSRAVAPRQALDMLLTGDAIDAETAQHIGLVNRVVPTGEAALAAKSLAAQIAAKSPAALRIGKRMFRAQLALSLSEAYALAGEAMVENMLDTDAVEGIDAFLGKRPPVWP